MRNPVPHATARLVRRWSGRGLAPPGPGGRAMLDDRTIAEMRVENRRIWVFSLVLAALAWALIGRSGLLVLPVAWLLSNPVSGDTS